MAKVFVSYSHKQADWVADRLVPCLQAGGAGVVWDRERFKAGKALVGQMDAAQDSANRHLLVLTNDYLASDYCRHEMRRAIGFDPKFEKGVVLPVRLDGCALPDGILRPNPLVVDLRDDQDGAKWRLLMDHCGADLGTTVPAWLAARDETVRLLRRGLSVNLVVNGGAKWRELVQHIAAERVLGMGLVDLEDPETELRAGLIASILRSLGVRGRLAGTHDLSELKRVLEARKESVVAIQRFDLAPFRTEYDVNLYAAIRFLTQDRRTLVLLIESRSPLETLLPADHPLSKMDFKTVELM